MTENIQKPQDENSAPGRKTNRRGFLKTAAYGVGGIMVLCSGLGVASTIQPKIDFYSYADAYQSPAKKKVLLAYGSKCGSTGEVAQAIAEELIAAGLAVDVLPVQQIKSVEGYQAIIIGSAVRMGKLLPKITSFAEKFSHEIAQLKTAYFSAGLGMKEDTPENRAEAEGYLQPLCLIKEPISKGLFAGKMDHSKLELGFRLIFSKDEDNLLPEGDYRDWEKIRGWGQEVAKAITEA
jgi:menaquinone-dependent protoporphyrinogen oxidase